MGNIWLPQTAPAVIATPDVSYLALFISDGTSGTTAGSLYSKNSAGTVTALTYSDEQAQDAVGTILTDTSTVDFTYDDAGNTISAIVVAGSIGATQLASVLTAGGPIGSASTTPVVTWDAKGRVTAVTAATITPAAIGAPSGTGTHSGASSGTNTGDQTFAATGDATAPGSTSNLALTLKNTGPGATGPIGSASVVPVVTIDAQGRTTALTSATITTTGIGAVPTTRNINTTAPITGGGDLSADRTIALTTSPAGQTPVGVTRNIGTTAPITGGGALSADLTLALTTSPAGQTPVGVTRQINTTAPMAGGGALSGDLTLSVPNATQTIAGLQSAADKKKQDLTQYDIVSQGGADPTGAVDCASIITAAIATFATAGTIYFPVGTYKFSSTITVNKEVVFRGAGRQHSIIELSSATANGFDVTSNYVGFENLRISATASNAALRTAGAAINLDNGAAFPGNISNCWVVGCDILFQWKSIILGAHTSWISNCNLREGGANAANGAHIEVQKFGDRYIDRITSDQGSNPTGFAGVRVLETSSLVINACNLVHCTTVLSLETQTGKNIPSIEVVNTFFDTSVTGFSINPTGTGTVYRCKFTNCWFSSMSGNGVTMNGAQWDGVTFVNCDFYGNVIGISCPTGGGNWSVQSSRFAGNTSSAINVTAGATHFPQIIGNHIGPVSAFGVNATGIIVGAGTYKGLVIANNNVVNNTTNATLGVVTVAAGEGSWYQIKDNAGINPLTGAAVTTPAVAASTAATTNTTGRRVIVFIKVGGTAITACSVNGVVVTTFINLAAAAATQVMLEPGGTIAFTYTVVPTWVWVGM